MGTLTGRRIVLGVTGAIAAYKAVGVGAERVLIKIASTWEGIRAAEQLEQEGIHCNLTLLFGVHQAVACAEAQVTLISPFVGRILDWYKKETGKESYPSPEDPGVLSVTRIYNYYKKHGYKTEVMGASFRNTGQIEALAGCDKLTIAPDLLDALAADEGALERKLEPEPPVDDINAAIGEAEFRLALNSNAMAHDLLGDGIRRFIADQDALEALLLGR